VKDNNLLWIAAAGVAGYFLYRYFATPTQTTTTAVPVVPSITKDATSDALKAIGVPLEYPQPIELFNDYYTRLNPANPAPSPGGLFPGKNQGDMVLYSDWRNAMTGAGFKGIRRY
jgi:hypothetical protein